MTNPIPEPQFHGKNLRDFPAWLEITSYGVAEWTPQDDGQGKPEAVLLHFELFKGLDGLQFAIRFKSRAEVNRLIGILGRHRDGVWPAGPQKDAR